MNVKTSFTVSVLFLILGLACPYTAPADVVGHISQTEGRVDLLKGGKPPATQVKLQEGVEPGDVIRTKSLSKAQITFIDNSVITLSPESRLAIDEYAFDPAKQKRNAVVHLFQGLAHVLVNKLYKVEEPDFVVKTHTAVTGVRGTDFGVRLQPNASTILNFQGITQVANIFPEVGQLMHRAFKLAYAFGSPGSHNSVMLKDMQGTEVRRGLPPTLPFGITEQDREQFKRQLDGGLVSRRDTRSSPGTVAGANANPSQSQPTSSVPEVAPLGLVTGTGNAQVTLINVVTVPPTVVPTTPITTASITPTPTPPPAPTPIPTPSTFSFTQQYYGAWLQMADSPYSQSTLVAYTWGTRTGVYAGDFYGSSTATRTATSGTPYASLSTGTSAGATLNGTVTGFLGQALSGTMDYTGINSYGNTVTRTGSVTIQPTGELTYTWTDTVTNSSGVKTATGAGTSTQTPGTYFEQTATGSYVATANSAKNQQTVTNSGDLTGSRTIRGGAPTAFRAGLSLTNTSPYADAFGSGTSLPGTVYSKGVLGAVVDGVRTGVTTFYASPTDPLPLAGGQVRDTAAATFSQVIAATDPTKPGQSSLGMLAQTTDSSAIIKTQTYEGSHTITPPGGTTGTLNGSGWGSRVEAGGTPDPSYYGTLKATVTDTSGKTLSSNVVLNQTVAAVVKPDTAYPYNYSGPAQSIAVANNNGIISTTGSVNFDSAGTMTHTFTGTYIGPEGSRGTIATVTPHQTFTRGEAFNQTVTGTLTSNSETPFNQQTTTNLANLNGTRSGNTVVAPGSFVISPNQFNLTNTAHSPGAFPSSSSGPVIIQSQGVIIPSGEIGGSGAMTTTIQGTTPGGPVKTVMGPVNITPIGMVNTPPPGLVGKNIVTSPTNVRIPATQVATVVQGPTVAASPPPALAVAASPTTPPAPAR
jgi:hypothetical protein